MKKKRFHAEQIVAILKQVELGSPTPELNCHFAVSS